jgi:flagellar hook protein FlgE
MVVAEDSTAGSAAFLTRAGSFVKDGDGYLVNAAGFFLMGVPWVNQSVTPTIPANGTAGLSAVQIQTLSLQASPSTTGTFNVNLPSNATVEANLPSANAAAPLSSYKSSLVVYDNLGGQVTLDIYASLTATANTWEITIFNQADAAATTVFPYGGAGVLATQTLTFDPTNGHLDTVLPSPTSITVPVPNGASLTLDMANTTQLATGFQVLEPVVDGNAPSAVDRVEIDDTGTLYAVYENGQREKKFLIPLATVASPDNLIPRAGNVFDLGPDSGQLLVGAAGTAGLGNLVPKALEKSTVDIASELTDMIEAQHSFTANSKVFQTAADLMEVLVNLSR